MRRRRHSTTEENKERWLVSYADFITLLFAFFVVMYSISSVNEGKYKVLSESLMGIFNSEPLSNKPIDLGGRDSVGPQVVGGEGVASGDGVGDNGTTSSFDRIVHQLGRSLADLVANDLVTIHQQGEWLELSLRTSLLFSSGDAVPSRAAHDLVAEIAAVLKDYPNAVLVEGFTDNVPIATAMFPSNWELSSARAAAVVRMLVENGLEPRRLAAIGYAEYQPIDRNDTYEGRQRNRRVVLLIGKDAYVRPVARPRE